MGHRLCQNSGAPFVSKLYKTGDKQRVVVTGFNKPRVVVTYSRGYISTAGDI